jgi:hypothetical protein
VLTWLDWYVRSCLQAPSAAAEIRMQMRLGATDPLMAFAEHCEAMVRDFATDRDAFAKRIGDPKTAEEMGLRLMLLRPFMHGFASSETRRTAPPGPPLGLLLTRETAALLADADPPNEDWRRRAFGSGSGQDGLGGIYVDVPHGALLVGQNLQVRAIFALPQQQVGADEQLYWTGGVLIFGLVTPAGSEHEAGSVFAAVEPDGNLSLVVLDPDVILGGIYEGDAVFDQATWAKVYQRVMEHSSRFLRMALAFHRYGPPEARQPLGRTPPDRAAANSLKPKKGESLFAVTRLSAPAGRLGRPPRTTTTGWNLAARQEVSGHFKLQPHGPAGSLRKLIWVEGYARGPDDAPRKPRAVRV